LSLRVFLCYYVFMVIIRSTKYNKNTTAALLGILETAGYFVNDHAITISSLSKEELDKIPRKEKNLFLFSFTTPHSRHAYADVETLRRHFPDGIFIAGGPHSSGDGPDCLANGFDEVVRGEGELALPELLKSGVRKPEAGIKNLPLTPDSGLRTPDLNNYPPFPLKEPRYALYIEITRGCPYACSFCQTSRLFGIKSRHRNVENILKYSEILLKNGMSDLRFVSPNSLSYGSADGKTINYKKLEELLSSLHTLVKDRGRVFFGSFPSEVRPEFVNDDTIALMKKYCDNDNIIIGGQSGSDRILELTHRGHKAADITKAAETALKQGLKVNVDFLFGFDFEDKEDAKQSIELMHSLIKRGARIHAHRLIPAAGTKHYGMKHVKINPKIMEFLNKYHGKGQVYGIFMQGQAATCPYICP
jgi:B12-binding domain/radical SAM domain protein